MILFINIINMIVKYFIYYIKLLPLEEIKYYL